MPYEAVIGLEIHVQLKTATKLFSPAPYHYGAAPNTLTDPVVLGLPGTLPVINREAIDQCVRLGLMFDCEIAEESKWDRKNYFYPDLPKNYQISQYDRPLCLRGEVEFELAGPSRKEEGEHKRLRLARVQLEEDPAKMTHTAFDSLLDFNRAGVPLAEIVTEPDLRSSDEVAACLNALRTSLVYAGVSDCDMEKGQLRCDANVSVRPEGANRLGKRTEMKNLNSVSNAKAAVDCEIERQIGVLEDGGEVAQETRRWDAASGASFSLRSKEEVHDYRYFPDPDLMPVALPREHVESLRAALPEKPFDKQRRFQRDYGLPYTVTSVLCPDRALSAFFERALETYHAPLPIANYVANDLLRELSAAAEEGEGMAPVEACRIAPAHIASLAKLVDDGVISRQIGKDVFGEMFATGEKPETIVETQGLRQSSDTGEIEALCREAIENNAKAVQQYKDGNAKAINALKGQVMKATQGKANPQVVDECLKRLIDAG